MPAHPSYPDDGGFSYGEILKAVRMQRHWAFVRVPDKGKEIAIIHFYAADGVPLTDVVRMVSHEIGHISGNILDDESAEEQRADSYADAIEEVFKILKLHVSRPKKPSSSRSSSSQRQAASEPLASLQIGVQRRRRGR